MKKVMFLMFGMMVMSVVFVGCGHQEKLATDMSQSTTTDEDSFFDGMDVPDSGNQ